MLSWIIALSSNFANLILILIMNFYVLTLQTPTNILILKLYCQLSINVFNQSEQVAFPKAITTYFLLFDPETLEVCPLI